MATCMCFISRTGKSLGHSRESITELWGEAPNISLCPACAPRHLLESTSQEGVPRSPGKSQKEGQEDQREIKELGGITLAVLKCPGPSGSCLGSSEALPGMYFQGDAGICSGGACPFLANLWRADTLRFGQASLESHDEWGPFLGWFSIGFEGTSFVFLGFIRISQFVQPRQ